MQSVLLLFLLVGGVLNHALQCPKPKVKDDFRLENFIGMWHVVQRTWQDTRIFKVCETALMEFRGKGKGALMFHYIDGISGAQGMQYFDITTPKTWKPNKLRATFVRGTDENSNIDFWILDTDYKNYAVASACLESFFPFHENIWILSRKTSLDLKVLLDIYAMLDERGFKRHLLDIHHQKCK